MRNLYRKVNKFVPLWSIIVFSLTIFSVLIYLLCALFEKFADFINVLCVPIRAALSVVTSIFPFSLFETFIFLSPFLLAFLIVLAVKIAKKGTIPTVRYLTVIVSIPLCYFIMFVWTFGSGYHTTTVENKLEISTDEISTEDMKEALSYLTNELNELKKEINYDQNGASVMPYSYGELSKKVSKAYSEMAKDTNLVKTFSSRIKPIILSDPMAYTHISGVYIALIGEANVNTAFSDYIITSTTAHEMAHQRGIAREDEASFVGFLALSYSSDPYLKYSAYLTVYYYLLSDLSKSSSEDAKNIYANLDIDIKNDYKAYVKSFEKYKDSTASKVTDTVNNSYLQANGDKDGTNSYNLVSKLVCAYLTQ